MKSRLTLAVLLVGLALPGCASHHRENPCASIARIQDPQQRVDAQVKYANGDSRVNDECNSYETPQQIRDDLAVMAKNPARYANWPGELAQ